MMSSMGTFGVKGQCVGCITIEVSQQTTGKLSSAKYGQRNRAIRSGLKIPLKDTVKHRARITKSFPLLPNIALQATVRCSATTYCPSYTTTKLLRKIALQPNVKIIGSANTSQCYNLQLK